MAFFGSTPQTGTSFNTSPDPGAGFFGSTSSPTGTTFPTSNPTPGGTFIKTDPEKGTTTTGGSPEQAPSWFDQGFIFNFDEVSDEFSWLGSFSLIGEEDASPIPVDEALRSFGLLASTGASAAEIETFLGLPPNTLNGLTAGYTPTNGAVLKLSLTDATGLNGVEELEFDWNFTTGESAVSSYDDFAFYATSDGQVGVLDRSVNVGSNASSGWVPSELDLNFDNEEVFIAFGVVNVNDTAVNSFVGVDEVELVGGPANQGPAMGSAFFGFDSIG
jgi:hypothetical protein